MDKTRRTFFWQGGGTKKKYHLIKWEIICKGKKKGGLGIKDLRNFNISLLCKWWWKLEKEEGLRQKIVKHKYLRKYSIHDVKHRLDDSPMWYDLLKVKNIYLQGRGVILGKGDKTRFWLDPWAYDKPLDDMFPILFELCENKTILVLQALEGGQISFRRWLFPELRAEWDVILRDSLICRRSNSYDDVIWLLSKNRTFSVKTVYNAMSSSSQGTYHK